MKEWEVHLKIKYESDLDREFSKEIMSMPGSESLPTCIQCGTCSSTCPLSIYMDYTPRRIIAMTRAGFRDEVLGSNTIWLCASCYSCTVECPKNIKITDVMYALKRKAIHENVFPKRFPTSVLAREFYSSVLKAGRNTESRLILRMFLKSNPFLLFRQAGMGLRLWLQGRLSLRKESIRGKEELQAVLKSVGEATSLS